MSESQVKNNNSTNPYLIPGSILLAGVLIAGAVIFGQMNSAKNQELAVQSGQNQDTASENAMNQPNPDNINPVTKDDHIRGNLDAKVKIVEYSDFECPYCKLFHKNLNEVMDKYEDSGEVAWVFRQLPLEQLHPKNALTVALASECVADIKGGDSFWKFADSFFENSPSNDKTDLSTVLPKLYKEIGVDQAKVESCIENGKFYDKITTDIQNAVDTGAQGTPWTIIIGPEGKTYPVNGAKSATEMSQIIDRILGS